MNKYLRKLCFSGRLTCLLATVFLLAACTKEGKTIYEPTPGERQPATTQATPRQRPLISEEMEMMMMKKTRNLSKQEREVGEVQPTTTNTLTEFVSSS